MIIDPRSGEIMQQWAGFLEPQDVTEKCALSKCFVLWVFDMLTLAGLTGDVDFVFLVCSVRLLLYEHDGRTRVDQCARACSMSPSHALIYSLYVVLVI